MGGQFVETTVTVDKTYPDKGFAFGVAKINGVRSAVYIGVDVYSDLGSDGRWEKDGKRLLPEVGDVLLAKICTDTRPGRSPFVVFWKHFRSDRANQEYQKCGLPKCACEEG